MKTASDIITRALTRAGIRASEAPVEDDEMQDGLTLLNDFLSSEEPSLQLGFAPVGAVGDNVRIPRYAEAGVIDALAVLLCPEYGKPVPQSLIISAKATWKNLLTNAIQFRNSTYPSTLPIGSGNEPGLLEEEHFYEGTEERNF